MIGETKGAVRIITKESFPVLLQFLYDRHPSRKTKTKAIMAIILRIVPCV